MLDDGQGPQSRPVHGQPAPNHCQGRKRIGLLVGAGAPAGIFPPGSDKPLIPAVAGLTDMVMTCRFESDNRSR